MDDEERAIAERIVLNARDPTYPLNLPLDARPPRTGGPTQRSPRDERS